MRRLSVSRKCWCGGPSTEPIVMTSGVGLPRGECVSSWLLWVLQLTARFWNFLVNRRLGLCSVVSYSNLCLFSTQWTSRYLDTSISYDSYRSLQLLNKNSNPSELGGEKGIFIFFLSLFNKLVKSKLLTCLVIYRRHFLKQWKLWISCNNWILVWRRKQFLVVWLCTSHLSLCWGFYTRKWARNCMSQF